MAFEILEGTLVLFRSGTRSKTLNFGLFSLALLWQIVWIDRRNWIPESGFQ